MNAKDVLRHSLDFNFGVVSGLLADLSDADLLVRPAPGANCIAWQIGHLIESEAGIIGGNVAGAKMPKLPDGFAKKHDKEAAKAEPPASFETKARYLELRAQVREATKAALAALPDADLDKPINSDLKRICPTVGTAFLLAAEHELMHSGQISVLRRKLGKPVLF